MSNHFHNPEPLSVDNAALVFVDNQVGLMTGIRDYSIAELKHNIVGLAQAARATWSPYCDYDHVLRNALGAGYSGIASRSSWTDLHRSNDGKCMGRSTCGSRDPSNRP